MNRAEVVTTIVENIREVIPELADQAISADQSLKELGANSVDRSEIIMMTMEALELKIPLIKVARAENIGDLADILCSEQ